MTNEELQKLAKEVYWELFQEEMPEVEIKFNTRMKTKKGKLVLIKKGNSYKPKRICLTDNFNKINNKYSMMRTLIHELCHLYLATKNKPFTDDSQEFQKLAKKYGVDYTTTGEYIGEVYEIKCKNCDCEYYLPTKTFIEKYTKEYECRECGGDLYFEGKKIKEDNYIPSEITKTLTDKYVKSFNNNSDVYIKL